jgi:hypothetical protein
MSGTRVARGLLLAAAVAAVVACSAPEHTFVASPEADLVLKLPRSWSAVRDETSSNAATGRPDGGWAAVFDGSGQPDAKHADVTTAASEPVVHARVTVLESGAAGAVTGDRLRDMVLPFTAAARAQVASDPRAATFRQISDYDVRSSAASGVHVVYSYDLGHGRQVFDLTAMVGSRRNRTYMLVVRCDEACYDEHRDEIAEVVSSFTVKVP